MSIDLKKLRTELEYEIAKEDMRKAIKNEYLLASLERFNKSNKINQNPPKKIIKKDNGYWHLPISWVHARLRKIFIGKVQWCNFFYTTIGNEITGTITLKVFHPIHQEWLEYVGTASKFIQQYKIDDKATPIDQWERYKFINGLEKTLPALKSMCEKNAAKQIGKCFGADLNRKEDKQSEEKETLEPHVQVQVFNAIKEALRDVAAINDIVNRIPHASKYETCRDMIVVARALAQCESGGDIHRLAAHRKWRPKFDNLIKLYEGNG